MPWSVKLHNHFPCTTIRSTARGFSAGSLLLNTSGSASTGPGVLNGAPVGAILKALCRANCRVTIPRTVIRRLHGGEPGMLSPGPPTHGPLASAAGLRGPARAHWVCPVPLFPEKCGLVSHPGDVRAGETGLDQARSVCGPRNRLHCGPRKKTASTASIVLCDTHREDSECTSLGKSTQPPL